MSKKQTRDTITHTATIGALALVFVIGVAVRWQHTGDTQFHDTYRDFLIAYNTVRGDAVPLVGPGNGFFGNMASPLYYYGLMVCVWLWASLPALTWMHMVWSVIGVACLYLAGRWFANATVGTLAAAAWWLSDAGVATSVRVFQPHAMIPLLFAGFALAAYGYRFRSWSAFALSGVALAASVALHNAAAPILIVMVVVSSGYIYRYCRMGAGRVAGYVGVTVAAFIACYIPVLYRLHSMGLPIRPDITQGFQGVAGLTERWPQIKSAVLEAVFFRIPGQELHELLVMLRICALICVALLAVIALWRGMRPYHTRLLVVGLVVAAPVVGALVLQGNVWQARHFQLLVGPLCVFLGMLIVQALEWRKGLVRACAPAILILLLLGTIGPQRWWNMARASHNLADGPLLRIVAARIADTALKSRTARTSDPVDLFDISLYQPVMHGWSDASLWVEVEHALEERLQTSVKLTTNNDLYGAWQRAGYQVLGEREVLYVVCDERLIGLDGSVEQCSDAATVSAAYPEYVFAETVVEQEWYHVYRLSRKTL